MTFQYQSAGVRTGFNVGTKPQVVFMPNDQIGYGMYWYVRFGLCVNNFRIHH